MTLLSLFQYIDIFGVEFNCTIFSQREYKTLSGSFLTIIFFVLAIYKLQIMLSQAINKTNFTVTEEKDILSGEDQNLTTLYLTVCAGIKDNETFIFKAMSDGNGTNVASKYNQTSSNQTHSNCYSYNLTHSVLSAGTSESGFSSGVKKLWATILLNNYDRVSDTLTFYIDEAFIKRSDYQNPVRHKNFQMVVSRISYVSQKVNINLQTIKVKHKNAYNFGFFSYEPESSENYTSYYSNSIETTTDYALGEGLHKYVSIHIYHSDWIITYVFNGFELDSALSDFGGYINVCFIIISFFGKFLNKYLLQKYVSVELNKGINYEELLYYNQRKTINKDNEVNNISNIAESINEIRVLNSKVNDINHDDVKKNYTIGNIQKNSKINCPNLSVNPGITENQEDSKIIISDNKNLISKEKITEEKYGQENKYEEGFKLYKNECDKIIDAINSRDELYNKLCNQALSKKREEKIRKKINERLFQESMDYSYFYIILKELKLLELLTLKKDDAKLFLEYNNKLLDYNKLMTLIKNKNIQDNIFSSKMYKEYAISKCVI